MISSADDTGGCGTYCPIEPCTSGYGSAGKRKPTTTTTTTPRIRTTTHATTTPAKMAVPTSAMVLCCWCALLLMATVDALPITSKPLDNNPDHLTWEAAWLSEDSRASLPVGGKTKKITPKSIFITPFLNSYNASACPPDYKVDYNGKCIQVVNINPADILVTKLQSLFSQHGDTGGYGAGTSEVDYDYDYDATGPFQVNLPLSIDLPPEPPVPDPKYTYKDSPGPSFYDSAMVDVASVDQDKAKITTVSLPGVGTSSERPFLAGNAASTAASTEKVEQSLAEGNQPDISFLAFESLPNGTLVGQVELERNNSTVVQNIFVSSTTAMADGRPTESAVVTELADQPGTTTDRASDAIDTDAADTLASTTVSASTPSSTQDPATITSTIAQGDVSSTINDDDVPTVTTDVGNSGVMSTSTTMEQDETDLEDFRMELEDELLLMDNNHSSIAPPPDASTTDLSEMDLDTLPTAETQPSDVPTLASKEQDAPSTEKPVSTSTTTAKPPTRLLVPLPTKASVQIITPIGSSWDLGGRRGSPVHLVAASHLIQQDRTTRATPETTTVAIEHGARSTTEEPAALMVQNDTAEDKKNRQDILRQETNDARRESNDASNRFVYNHLSVVATSTIAPTSTEADKLLVRPLATTPANPVNSGYLEQLRKINEIVAEKRRLQQQQEQQLGAGPSSARIRFPSRDEQDLSVVSSSNSQQPAGSPQPSNGGLRFPGSATNRLPDIFPKKSPDSTTQRPAFWWLPSGWEVDQTGNKPMLLRFWSRMPLVRDSAIQPAASDSEPGNSVNTGGNRWRSATGFQQPASNHIPAAPGAPQHPVATARGNSKSPSENFYKEVSAQEVYKVMNARQMNHHGQS
ncbi:mucin-5AC-like [Anopheles nili]|uniref:mucin-5AC-like n=1 Tax=Anopheles nili TaxID=185578 RepID=UPI00237BD0FF|nr:mucin-5AC-like [Anopheles nili]